ncbi:MAG: hypothetical protein WBJ21_13220 [Burkholderiaceae bacterium]
MIRRIKFFFKWLLAIMLLIGAAFFLLASYTNVATTLTNEDKIVFRRLGLGLSFEDQISLIRKIQHGVFAKAPLGDGIPDYESREPADLMKFGQGLCFDRSRTFDKAFHYVGLETRHVYILYKNNLPFWRAVFKYGQPSHAVTEVKTSKGWMFVDSNTEWVAITRQGEPVNADDVWRRFEEFESPPPYLQHPWWAIRGMYSRKGQLYGAGIPFPEFNWQDFLAWFVLHK